MNLITSQHETFEIDYRDQALPSVLIDTETDLYPLEFDWLKPFESCQLINMIEQSKSTLLLAMDRLDDQNLIDTIQDQADKGVRVYLCLGTEQNNKAAIDHLRSRCLIRTGICQKGSLIIRDHHSLHKTAWILTGSPETGGYQITLNKQQTDDSFRSFSKLFWEEASQEYIADIITKAQTVNSQIVVNHHYQIKNGLKGYFDVSCQPDYLIGADDALQKQLDFIVNSPGHTLAILGEHQLELAQNLIEQQSSVVLTEQWLPNLIKIDQTCWLLPQSFDRNMCNWALKLEELQAQAINGWIQDHHDQARWQLSRKPVMQELEGKTIRFTNNLSKDYECYNTRECTLPPVYTQTMDEFLQAKIKTLTKKSTVWTPEQLALEIEYSVERHPPYCPENAKADPLHNLWEQAQNQWKKAIDTQKTRLNRVEQQQNQITDSIRHFIGQFILGQKQRNKSLLQTLDQLAQWDGLAATPSQRSEHVEKLQALASDITDRTQLTQQEIAQAEQQQRWEQKKHPLVKAITEAKKGLVKAQTDHHDRSNLLKDQLAQTEQTWLQQRNAVIQQLPENKQKELPADFNLSEALKFFTPKKNKKAFKNLYQTFGTYSHQYNQVQQQLEQLEKNLLAAEKRLAEAQQQLEDHGEHFSPQGAKDHLRQQLGIESQPVINIQWPTEELPSNNLQLHISHNKQRYLVLSEYTYLEQARADAERLNASLCVPRYTHNE